MPPLINRKFQACFARVTVTFSRVLNPVAFWTSCAAPLEMVQSGTVCHYSAVTNFCGSFCLDGHVITEQCDSLKHLGAKRNFFFLILLWPFNLLTVENADADRNFVSLMSTWSKGCSFGSSGLRSSESQFHMTFFPPFIPPLHSMQVCMCYKVFFLVLVLRRSHC